MPGKFIVVFKDGTPQAEIDKQKEDIKAAGGQITNEYDPSILNGFAAVIPDDHFKSVQGSSSIDYIEPDGVVTIQ